MTTTTFDSLKYFEKLKAAGFTETQAKAQTEVLREIVDDRLVSQDYLDYRLKELEYRLVIRLGGIAVGCTAILLAALPLILK